MNPVQLTQPSSANPVLSLILCSRNDQYMGNSLWRLQTALNYVARNIEELGRDNDVEILVADWGSEVPLCDVLELSPAAARITSFILIPKQTAGELQQDSPFAEVFALNAAARRARGDWIGRIDQDTLVGKRFLQVIFELHEGKRKLDVPLGMMFANVKMVPYRFAVRCPSFSDVELFIKLFGRSLARENSRSTGPYYFAGVGIWLLQRKLWDESGGYDERMIYMNAMETNMILRLLPHYKMINVGELSDYDFYHLEHYHPWWIRKTSTHRKTNPHLPFSKPDSLNPNGGDWGLIQHPFQVVRAKPILQTTASHAVVRVLSFLGVIARVAPIIILDTVGLFIRRNYKTWTHRAELGWSAVNGKPIVRWPQLLRKLWNQRSLTSKS